MFTNRIELDGHLGDPRRLDMVRLPRVPMRRKLVIETVGSSSLAMKPLIYSKRLQYYRFEQIRTLRPNATIP